MKNTLRITTFLLLCISNTLIYAASKTDSIENNIFKAKTFKVGFYLDYQDFLTNSPTIQKIAVISKRTEGSLRNQGGGFYRIDYLLGDTAIEYNNRMLNKLVKESWGYCDGSNIYIFDNKIHKVAGRNMSKIKLLDNISLVEHYEIEYARSNSNAGVMLGAFTGGLLGAMIVSGIQNSSTKVVDTTLYTDLFHPDFTYLLDNTSNGKTSLYYYKSVVEILYYKDSELYDQFMKVPLADRKALLPKYVMLFNQRNPVR